MRRYAHTQDVELVKAVNKTNLLQRRRARKTLLRTECRVRMETEAIERGQPPE